MPEIYEELDSIREKLERHYTDTQDIEFTIQAGKLWMLQTRTGKRTAEAAVRIAVEMEAEGLIDRKTAIHACRPGPDRAAASPDASTRVPRTRR